MSSEGDAHKIRELQHRCVVTRDTKIFVNHVSDLSSSRKAVVFLGFLLFQEDLFPEVRDRQDLQGRRNLGVQHLQVGLVFFTRSRVGRSEVINIQSCLNFPNPRHRIRGMTRNRTNFSSKIQLPAAER